MCAHVIVNNTISRTHLTICLQFVHGYEYETKCLHPTSKVLIESDWLIDDEVDPYAFNKRDKCGIILNG